MWCNSADLFIELSEKLIIFLNKTENKINRVRKLNKMMKKKTHKTKCMNGMHVDRE